MHSYLKFAITFSLRLIIDFQTRDPDLQLCEDLTVDAAVIAHIVFFT